MAIDGRVFEDGYVPPPTQYLQEHARPGQMATSGIVLRPQQLYDFQMDRIRRGWHSLEELRESLRRVPSPANTILVDEYGTPYRTVMVSMGPETRRWFDLPDGRRELRYAMQPLRRNISLTVEGAKRASMGGIETDFWTGYTWLRRGVKPERDLAVATAPQNAPAQTLVWETVDPTDQALALAEEARRVTLAVAAQPTHFMASEPVHAVRPEELPPAAPAPATQPGTVSREEYEARLAMEAEQAEIMEQARLATAAARTPVPGAREPVRVESRTPDHDPLASSDDVPISGVVWQVAEDQPSEDNPDVTDQAVEAEVRRVPRRGRASD